MGGQKLLHFRFHFMRCHSKIVAVLLYLFPVSLTQAVNYTIDDSFGDSRTGEVPTFLPLGGDVWADQTCEGCAIKPDVSQAFMGTYTAATYNPNLGNISISMGFQGTAIYVFFTLPNFQGEGITTVTVADFTIDGSHAGHFTHEPDESTTEILYQQMVFSATDLSNEDHQLVISTTGLSSNTFTNFDYAIYTLEDVIATSPSTPDVPSTTTSSSNEVIPTASSTNIQSSPDDEDRSASSTTSVVATSSSTASTLSSSSIQSSSSSFQTTASHTTTLLGTLQPAPHVIQSKTSSSTSESSSTASSSVTAAADNNNNRSHSNTTLIAAVAGGVSGVVVLVSGAVALLLWRRWKARKNRLSTPTYRAVALGATRASLLSFSTPNPSDSSSSSGWYQPATLPGPESLSFRASLASSASVYSQSASTQIEGRSPTDSNLLEERFNDEMDALSAGHTASYPAFVSNSAWNDSASEMVIDVDEINEVEDRMQEIHQSRIELLQLQQRSSWVPDDPPPYYTP